MGSTDEVRVGIVGSGQIAGAHSAAYRTVAGTYPEAPRDVALTAVADVDRERAGALAQAWGWSRAEVDWRAITQADDVDLVDICVPNALHAEIAIDALAHGKHVVCEKPLASDWSSARAMVQAADAADRVAQVCFYYRVWPAVTWAAELCRPAGSAVRATSGAGCCRTTPPTRPTTSRGGPGSASPGPARSATSARTSSTWPARCAATSRRSAAPCTRWSIAVPPRRASTTWRRCWSGSRTATSGVLEASWALRGHHCDLGFDLVCEHGGVRFSWERFNEVQVLEGDAADPTNGYRVVHIGKGQPDVDRFVSVPGQGMGYRDTFTIGVSRALTAIAAGQSAVAPSFADGLAAALVVDATQRSARDGGWVDVAGPDAAELLHS